MNTALGAVCARYCSLPLNRVNNGGVAKLGGAARVRRAAQAGKLIWAEPFGGLESLLKNRYEFQLDEG